ncbi:MAG TPA: GGDEF domain-containing protein [Edaphobacter sp.]|jgi:diguanylate cyclase (GGDEF)-like protein|nr:GGDEF domain-containing protein [Edaphobacter sp.]
MYPRLRGAGTFSLGFCASMVACSLFVARGFISDLASVVLANGLVFTAFALFYYGTLRFFQSPRKIGLLWIAIALSTTLQAYFTLAHNLLIPRFLVAGLTFFLIRSLIAIELFLQSAGRPFVRGFAILMSFYAVFGLTRVFLILFNGAPQIFLEQDALQTSTLVFNVIFVCIMGLCFLLMLSGELMAALENQSFEDVVSGALNRRGIEQKLAIELGCAKRSGIGPSIALIDIDRFKAVNDTQGHAAGDRALRQVALAISSNLRNYDFLGRYGGDEFLLILPQASCQDAQKVVERIEHAIRGLAAAKNGFPITVSSGITQAIPFEPADSLLARADAALYEAKHAGRNCSRIVTPSQTFKIPEPTACFPT